MTRNRDAAAGAAGLQHGRGRGSDQVDATIAIASMAKPLAAAGQAHIIGWAGDIVPYQITAVFTTARMVAQHADLLQRFASAYQRGVADYREAFLRLDAQGKPILDATTDAAIPLIDEIRFTGDPDARTRSSPVSATRRGAALDVADVIAQVQWFQAQDLVKGDADPHVADRHAFPADAMSAGLRLELTRHKPSFEGLPVFAGLDLSSSPATSWCYRSLGLRRVTLLGILGGLLAPSAARSRGEGEVAAGFPNAFTYVFQDFALLPWRTTRKHSTGAGGAPATGACRRVSRRRSADRTRRLRPCTGRGSSRVGCASGSASPGRWRCGRPVCCWTSRSRRWTRRRADCCWRSSPPDLARPALPPSMSPTTSTRRSALAERVCVLSRRPGRVRDGPFARSATRRTRGDGSPIWRRWRQSCGG